MSLLKLAGKYNKQNPRSPFCVSRVLCNINVSSYGDTVSRSLDFEPTLFIKVKVFTLKKCPPFRELLRTRETPNMEEEMGRVTKQNKKTFSSKNAAIIHVKCWNILPEDLRCVLSWGLSWSQLHFQPVEQSGILWAQQRGSEVTLSHRC